MTRARPVFRPGTRITQPMLNTIKDVQEIELFSETSYEVGVKIYIKSLNNEHETLWFRIVSVTYWPEGNELTPYSYIGELCGNNS